MWLYGSIINTIPMDLVLSYSLNIFYKNNEIFFNKKKWQIGNNNWIKIKMLHKLKKIKWSHLSTLIIDNDN